MSDDRPIESTAAIEVARADALSLESDDNPADQVTALRWLAQEVRADRHLRQPELIRQLNLINEEIDRQD